jgi:hypothetical protein
LSLSRFIFIFSPVAAPKEKRAPSAYNVFMKTEVEKVKKANPSLKPAEAFKAAALNVSSSLMVQFISYPFSLFLSWHSGPALPKTLSASKCLQKA